MASLIFNSCLDDAFRALIDFDTDTFKCLLVTSTYSPNKDTHTRRSDITNEVSGTGYTAGGAAATVTVTKDTANDRIDTSLGAASWSTATITARGAVYYKSRGGASSADELVAYIDFGADITSTAGTFALTASTLRIQKLMATGTATINFGVASAGGSGESSVDVTGQSGLSSASYIEAFDMAEATANHTADDVRVDRLLFACEYLTSSSFRIHAQTNIGRAWGDRSVRWVTA